MDVLFHTQCAHLRKKRRVTPLSNYFPPQAWQLMPIIPEFGELRQEDWHVQSQAGLHRKFQAVLGYKAMK